MATMIALLRGINVSGKNKIKMADLRALLEGLGLHDAQTYVQSGNIVFDSDEAPADLVRKIHEGIEAEFGYAIEVLVRSADEWRRLVEGNPFAKGGAADPKFLHVTLLAEAPDEAVVAGLEMPDAGDDEFHINGRVVYLHCPNGYGRSKLTNNFWERKLKVAATTRNWKTVNTLLEMAEATLGS